MLLGVWVLDEFGASDAVYTILVRKKMDDMKNDAKRRESQKDVEKKNPCTN